jgi:hypothetical protein
MGRKGSMYALEERRAFLSGSAGRSSGTDNSRHSQSSDRSVTTRAVLNSSYCELGAVDSLTKIRMRMAYTSRNLNMRELRRIKKPLCFFVVQQMDAVVCGGGLE